MKASAFIAISLDGYIARPDHRLDWLEEADSDIAEDYGYETFIKRISAVVVGRKTFEKLISFPEWPFQRQRCILLSSTIKTVPGDVADQVQLYNGDIKELAQLLEAEGETHLYVDGSSVIQAFIAAGLLTDIIITTTPILIGEGISLFGGPLTKDIRLKHVSTKAFRNGFVKTHYSFS